MFRAGLIGTIGCIAVAAASVAPAAEAEYPLGDTHTMWGGPYLIGSLRHMRDTTGSTRRSAGAGRRIEDLEYNLRGRRHRLGGLL